MAVFLGSNIDANSSALGYFILRHHRQAERIVWLWIEQGLYMLIGLLGIRLFIFLGKSGLDNERLGYQGDVLPERIARTSCSLAVLMILEAIFGGHLIAWIRIPVNILTSLIG